MLPAANAAGCSIGRECATARCCLLLARVVLSGLSGSGLTASELPAGWPVVAAGHACLLAPEACCDRDAWWFDG